METLRKIIRRILYPYRRRPSRTVRFAFPIVLVGAAVLMASVASVNEQPVVLLEVSPTQVEIGESAQLDIRINTAKSINALTIIINAPTDRVLMDSIRLSDSVITLWTEEPQIKDGKIILRGGTFRRGFVGEHTIAQVDFTPSSAGPFSFTADNIELIAGDGQGTVIRPEAEMVRSDTVYAFSPESAELSATDKSRFEEAIRKQLQIATDRAVGLRDVSRFMSAWTSKSTVYDFDGDGSMTFRDFAILLAYSFGL